MDKLVQVEKIGCLSVISMNRPKALNALSLELLIQLNQALQDAFDDSQVKTVWLESSSDRAFCAGGDVKALAQEINQLTPEFQFSTAHHYFEVEFNLDRLIENSPKPVVTFAQGYTFGGGWGLFAGGNLRLCDETASFAMPETLIGYYPDVGAAEFLQADDWKVGTFLGISSITIDATEALALSYVDDVIDADYASVLKRQLSQGLDTSELDILSADVETDTVLAQWQQVMALLPEDGTLNDWIAIADANTPLSPFERAKKNWNVGSSWSVAVTWHYFADMRNKKREDVLETDKVFASNLACHSEFYEGISAKLIDKGRSAQWKYPHVESVPTSEIEALYLSPES